MLIWEIENGPVIIVDFPINSMVDLSIAMLVITREYLVGGTGRATRLKNMSSSVGMMTFPIYVKI